LLDVALGHGRGVDARLERVDAVHPGDDLDAHALAEELPRDRAGGDARGRLAGARAAAAARVARAVPRAGGGARVRRGVLVGDLVVVLRALVLVRDLDRDRRPGRPPLVDAREDARGVLLLALRREERLAGAAAREVVREVGLGEREARRATVHDRAERGA